MTIPTIYLLYYKLLDNFLYSLKNYNFKPRVQVLLDPVIRRGDSVDKLFAILSPKRLSRGPVNTKV